MKNIAQAKSINQLAARLIVEELIRLGCTNFFISPGSRSTPLTLAASENNNADLLVHFDERAAAFAAVCCARASGNPAVLICTSGTAGANYYPAVVEASADRIPLIILTADRPPELQGVNSNQTIDQQNLYGEFVRNFENINPPDKDLDPNILLKKIDSSYFLSTTNKPGPVHLNIMFREPLAPVGKDKNYRTFLKPITDWLNSTQPLLPKPTNHNPANSDINKIIEIIKTSKNSPIVICGYLKNKKDAVAIDSFCKQQSYLLLADIRSGLRLKNTDHQLNYYDLLLLNNKNLFKQPLTILHFGGNFISKRLLNFIEQAEIENYIHIDSDEYNFNPHHRTTDSYQLNITQLCRQLSKENIPKAKTDRLLKTNLSQNKKIDKHLDNYCNRKNKISEISVARLVSKNIRNKSHLFLGGSMPVRDFDSFAGLSDKTISTYGNRGASGIDGSIASFCGLLKADNKPGTAIIGDLAFLHDINSLTLLKQIKKSAVLIVINNNGGGIFSFLPVAKATDSFEQIFATPHAMSFEKTSSLFDIDYCNPSTNDEFIRSYNKAQKTNYPMIIEIKTERDQNYKQHKKLYAEIIKSFKDKNIK